MRKAVSGFRAKPRWPSAIRIWPIRKTPRTRRPWPTRPLAKINRSRTNPASAVKAAVAEVIAIAVEAEAEIAAATVDLVAEAAVVVAGRGVEPGSWSLVAKCA